MIVYDLETKGFSDAIVIGGMFDGRTYKTFTSPIELLDFCLERDKRDKKVYAHNAGKFDNKILEGYFRRAKIHTFGFINISGALCFKVKHKGVILDFRDSMLLLPHSLDKLTKAYDVKHKKVTSFDMDGWISSGYPITDELLRYLRFDVLGLWEVLQKFKKNIPIEPKLTIASTAFSVLMETDSGIDGKPIKDITVNLFSKELENKIRNAYRGGRTEVFKREATNVNHFDNNSIYPSTMKNLEFPYGRFSHTQGKPAQIYYKHEYEGVSLAKVEAPNTLLIPYLGIHKDGKLIFPLGKFTDWYSNFELREAEKLGYKIEIIEGVYFDKKGKIFQNFVEQFEYDKINSTGAKKEVAKLFLNSPTGKFGQKRIHTKILTTDELYKAPAGVLTTQLNSNLFAYDEESYRNRQINPLYVIYITAYARDMLYKAITVSGVGNICYCDTDSIITTGVLPDNMIDKDAFGLWGNECKEEHRVNGETIYPYYIGIAPKIYGVVKPNFHVVIKAKGVPYSKSEDMTTLDLYNILHEGLDYKVKYRRLVGLSEKTRRLDTRNNENNIIQITQEKVIKDSFDKRIVCDDNIHTLPLTIVE